MPRVNMPAFGLTGRAPAGLTLHEAMRGLGHVVDYACGGNALCGTCCVLVVEGAEGLSPADAAETARLKEMGVGRPHRLSCQARLLNYKGEITLVAC